MAALSKEEYLKRYLSCPDTADAKKKKRRKPKAPIAKQPRSRIIDDDIDLKKVTAAEDDEVDLYPDEGPTIAGETDERPEEVRQLESYRASKHWKTLEEETEERNRHDSGSGQSSPRRQRHDSGSDQSPARKQRHDSGSDRSPPRRKRHDSASDQSPPRRQRHDSGSDQSPPRKQRHDSGSDQSPPRRKRHDSGSDRSPPRRKRRDSGSDQSPPRRKKRYSDSDQSPPRKGKPSLDSDHISKQTKDDQKNPRSRRRKGTRFDTPLNADQDNEGKLTKTLSGLKAGLSTAQAMRRENEQKRDRENVMFQKTDDAVLGRNAKTVFRDKETGRRRNLVAEGEAEAVENAKKEAMAAKYQEWGRGLAQQASQSAQVAEALHEVQKPLARLRGDQDLEQMLREKERDGDPMLAFLSKKKKAGPKGKEKPRYKGPQPPQNRFNIWPGYRWDGIERSNGFEKSLFSKQAERKAQKEDAYKWSIEDM